MRLILTIEIVKERLQPRGIEILDIKERYFAIDRHKCKCLICSYEWSPRLGDVFKYGCPSCAGNAPITKERLSETLAKKNIDLYGNFNIITDRNGQKMHRCKCSICNHGSNGEWLPHLSNILRPKHGCPNCAWNLPLTNEYIDAQLTANDRQIARVGDYLGNNKKHIDFQCLICLLIWPATPHNIINHSRGCPKCKWRVNQKIMFQLLEELNMPFKTDYCLNRFDRSDIRLFFDAYILGRNIALEYDGEQHFIPVRFGGISQAEAQIEFEKTQIRDLQKNKFCIEHNITLFRINGMKYKYDKLKEYMRDEIIPNIKEIISQCQT
jgi:hypothetical protein